jgi:DivIVA domain-containing protein
MREDLREVDFPVVLRGYERVAVDRYIERVNRLIAELEISSSPESAIRHALEEVSEETSGLLERAYETAEEITARSRDKADDRLQEAEREAEEVRAAAASEAKATRETANREAQELRGTAMREARDLSETTAREAQQVRTTAQREAEEMRVAAEARVRDLTRNAEAVWRERRRLLDDMRALAEEQLQLADAAAARFPRALEMQAGESAVADEPMGEGDAADDPPAGPPTTHRSPP